MRRMKDEGEGMKAAEVETLTVPVVPEESPMTEPTIEIPIEGVIQTFDGEIGEGIQLGPEGVESVQKEPPRNIIFVGDGEPSPAYHGAFSVELPDAKTQKRGFYHPQARQIIGHFPKKYKKFIRIGE